MDLKDLSAYLTVLLRSGPEVVAAFFMGILLTGMLGFWLRHRLFSSYDAGIKVARRDAEIDRKDAHIAVVEAKLAVAESRLSEETKLIATLRGQGFVSYATEATCADLRAENLCLRQDKQSAEADAADLRAKLAQARDEVDHWAKWAIVHEENAQLAAIGSLKEG
jgi:hypothetical protein